MPYHYYYYYHLIKKLWYPRVVFVQLSGVVFSTVLGVCSVIKHSLVCNELMMVYGKDTM